jgi:hypothetical protein
MCVWMKWWSSILWNICSFDNTWKLNLERMEKRFGAWLMSSLSLCTKWNYVMVHVMRMLSMQLDTRLYTCWWIGIRKIITLSHLITFCLTLNCFDTFWRLGCTQQRLIRLIVKNCLVLWLLIQREDQEDNSNITCMFQVNLFLGLITN